MSATPTQRPPVVTLAALFGAGGSYVGPRVAERLGVPFLDRAIPASVARRAGVPEDAVEQYLEGPKGTMGKLIANLARIPVPNGSSPLERFEEEQAEMRVQIEEFAERRLPISERARKDYVQSAYGVDGEDPDLYHLLLATSALDLDTCVDFIVTASRRIRQPVAT